MMSFCKSDQLELRTTTFFALYFQLTSNPFVSGALAGATGTITLRVVPRSVLIFPSFFSFIPTLSTRALVRLSRRDDQSLLLINSCDRLLAHRATVAQLHIQVSPYRSQSRQSIRLQACRTSTVNADAVVRMGYAPQEWENTWVNFWYREGCIGGWQVGREWDRTG